MLKWNKNYQIIISFFYTTQNYFLVGLSGCANYNSSVRSMFCIKKVSNYCSTVVGIGDDTIKERAGSQNELAICPIPPDTPVLNLTRLSILFFYLICYTLG